MGATGRHPADVAGMRLPRGVGRLSAVGRVRAREEGGLSVGLGRGGHVGPEGEARARGESRAGFGQRAGSEARGPVR
jgi:hypothetical protein